MSRPVCCRALLLAVLVTLTPGCNDITFPQQSLPRFIAVLGGDGQTAEVGMPLPDSVVVRVTDGTGRPVQDVVVRFFPAVVGGGQIIPDTAQTNVDGTAATSWILGTRAGPVLLDARVPDGQGGVISIRISATAVAGRAESIRIFGGSGQSATVGTSLADSLVVLVTDRFGNTLAGEQIVWQTADGALSDSATVTTSNGRAAVAWRLGSRAGPQAARATLEGVPGSPLDFRATALPGSAVALLKIFGDSQTAPIGTQLTDSVVARLVDAFGNGVPGRSINWVLGGGGGVAPVTGVTDADGYAFSRWTLAANAGAQLLYAVVSGYEPVTFTATGVSQAPATLEAVSSTALIGQAGQPVSPPPAVRVLDGSGNPVPGVTVTFAVRGSGGEVASRTGRGKTVTGATDAAGVATVTSWTLDTIAGADTLEASAVGSSGPLIGSPIRFIALGLPGPASRLAFLDQPTTTVAGRPMTPAVTVAVQDPYGNLVASHSGTVMLTLESFPAGGTLGGSTTAGVAGGIATFGGLTLERAGTGYTLSANAQPALTPATSDTFTVIAGPAARLAMFSQPSDTVASGAPFARQPAITLEDAFGNRVGQSGVAITAAISSGGGTLGGTLTATTVADGSAAYTDLVLAGRAGPRILGFSAPGLLPASSTPVVLVAGRAAILELAAGGGQTANVGTPVAVPPAVRVTDQSGNPVPGVAVAFAVSGGGGGVTGPNAVTDANGIATVGGWQLGPGSGSNTLTATAAGLDLVPLAITATGRFAFSSVRGGAAFSCGLSTAGAAYCWGRNNRGQVGDGGTTDRLAPVAVAGGLTFTTLGVGSEHACGLTPAGTAYCWGFNSTGQLGDGSTTSRPTPVPVTSTEAFIRIEGGDAHTCALTAGGAAYCWGENNRGQLGDGTSSARFTPAPVTGGLGFSTLALGTQFSCGLSPAGTGYCWGLNSKGQLGGGNKNQPTPVPISGTGWTALAAGEEFACAIAAGGIPSCWGRNDKGQLGDNSKGDRGLPGPVAGGVAFARLSAGGKHACAVTLTGAAYCWGQNADGELGDGTGTERAVPAAVLGGHQFSTVSTGSSHSLAVTANGVAYGWGRDADGQLGTGTTSDKLTPVTVNPP